MNGLSSSEMSGNQPISRVRRCRCCGETGHDRRTCPNPVEVERRRQIRITQAEQRDAIRIVMNTSHTATQPTQPTQATQPTLPPRRIQYIRYSYRIYNEQNYPMNIYWSNIGDNSIRYTHHIEAFGSTTIKAMTNHRLVFIPISESLNKQTIDLSNDNYFIAGDFNLCDFDNIPIHITKEYKQPKRELDKWKECGLKSLFLLKELDRLGATKYDNLAPIMDMIQDIQLPDHTELDKDVAGVPSVFTNLT